MNRNSSNVTKKIGNLILCFSHGMHNIKNSHQIDNNNQQLTIVSIHAKIEICLIIFNIIIIYIIEVSMIISYDF